MMKVAEIWKFILIDTLKKLIGAQLIFTTDRQFYTNCQLFFQIFKSFIFFSNVLEIL